jgi:hypothetical protein
LRLTGHQPRPFVTAMLDSVTRRFLRSTLVLFGALSLLFCLAGTAFLIFCYLIGTRPEIKGGFIAFAEGWRVTAALLFAARRLQSSQPARSSFVADG